MTNDNTAGLVFHDVQTNLRIDDDKAIFRRTQHIDDRFLDDLSDHRTASANAPTGDFHLAASIPVVVVEQWMAEGFNIYDPNVGLEAIMKKLRQHDMERLIASGKRLS